MAISKRLQKARRAGADLKRVKLEIRKLRVELNKGIRHQKRLDSDLKNVTDRLGGIEIYYAPPRGRRF
jgi:hypothetical protein